MKHDKLWNRTKTLAKIQGISNWYDIYLMYWKSGGRGMKPVIEYWRTKLEFVGFLPDHSKAVFRILDDQSLRVVDPVVFHEAKKLFTNTDLTDIDNPEFITMKLDNLEFLVLATNRNRRK